MRSRLIHRLRGSQTKEEPEMPFPVRRLDGSRVSFEDPRPVNVRDFASGAIGNGESATGAFSKAQEFCRTSGRSLWVPKGIYGLEATIKIRAAQSQFVIEGDQGTRETESSTGSVIVWQGNTTEPIFQVMASSTRIEGLTLRVAAGKTTRAGIEIDKDPLTGTAVTNPVVIGCQILGDFTGAGGAGNMTDGIVIGPTAGVDNLEYGWFERVNCSYQTHAGFFIASTTGESLGHTLLHCIFGGQPWGVKTQTGSFTAINVQAGRNSSAAYGLGTISSPIAIYGGDSEGASRYIWSWLGASTTPGFLLLENMRVAVTEDAQADFIVLGSLGPLTLRNVMFQYTGDGPAPGDLKVVVGASGDATINSSGCLYQSANPWTTLTGRNVYVNTMHDWYYTFTGAVVTGHARIPSEIDRVVAGP